MKNLKAIRTMERINSIIEELKQLQQEFDTLFQDEKIEEEIIDEEYNELIENDYYDWENDLDDNEDEENEIYKIHFNEEQFTLLFNLTSDIPFGYVHDNIGKKYIISVDNDTLDEIKERLDLEHYDEKYVELYSTLAHDIVELQNIIYEQVKQQLY